MTLRIKPIGSCRIWNPLLSGQKPYDYSVDRSRYLGFAHTSAEAVQQVRYALGRAEIPADMMHFVMHDSRQSAPTDGPMETLPDLAIVEISSAKHFELDGLQIQVNCMLRAFPEFFADADRKNGFIRCAKVGDQAQIDGFLEQAWSDTAAQRSEAEMLRRIRHHFCSEDELRRDVRELIETFPAVLFVTHVDAVARNGEKIQQRSEFIDLVMRVVQEEGGRAYNPTERMEAMGQALAMPQDGNHFSPDFWGALLQDWHEIALAPLLAEE